MANVSRIKLENTTYDIKDTVARNRDNYSTTEQAIGTWIDGKTIYRKVYDLTCTLDNNYYYTYTGDSSTIMNIDTIVKYDAYIKRDTVIFKIPNSKSYNCMTYIQRSYGGISLACDTSIGTSFDGKPLIIILEYTKVNE